MELALNNPCQLLFHPANDLELVSEDDDVEIIQEIRPINVLLQEEVEDVSEVSQNVPAEVNSTDIIPAEAETAKDVPADDVKDPSSTSGVSSAADECAKPMARLQFTCPKCTHTASSFAVMERHKEMHRQQEKIHRCSYCEFSTQKKGKLTKHKLFHEKRSAFQCSICSYSVATKQHLVQHQKRSHAKYVAAITSPVAKAEAEASSTEELSSIESAVIAKKKIKQKSAVAHGKVTKKILRKKPSAAVKEVIKNPSGKFERCEVYVCNLCNYWAKTPKSFHTHMVDHSKTPSYYCSVCNFTHMYRSSVWAHIHKVRKAGGTRHQEARSVLMKEIPHDEYAEYRKLTFVRENLHYGRFSSGDLKVQKAMSELFDSKNTTRPGNSSFVAKLQELCNSLPSPPISCEDESNNTALVVRTMTPDLEETVISNYPIGEFTDIEECRKAKNRLYVEIQATNFELNSLKADLETAKQALLQKKQNMRASKAELWSCNREMQKCDDERARLAELKHSLNSRISQLTKEKFRTEMDVRVQQCEILKLRLALLENDDAEPSNESQAVLVEKEEKTDNVEAKLSSVMKQLEGYNSELQTAEKELTEMDISRNSNLRRKDNLNRDLAVAESIVSLLQQRLTGLNSQMKELVARQRQRVDECSKLEVYVLRLTFKESMINIQKTEQNHLVELGQFVVEDSVSVDEAECVGEEEFLDC